MKLAYSLYSKKLGTNVRFQNMIEYIFSQSKYAITHLTHLKKFSLEFSSRGKK